MIMKNILAITMFVVLGVSTWAQDSEPIVTSTMEEECAMYPTGYEGLIKFINNEVNYPQDCVDQGISGKVYVRFVVNRSGNVSKATVTKSAHPSLDKEALRVTNLLHWNWNPACKDSAIYMSLPINFEVGDDTESNEEDDDKPSPHFSGIDIGFGNLMMDNPTDYPYWNTSDLNVFTIGFNLFEYKLPIFKQYLGLTTGLGFNLSSVDLGQYDLVHTSTVPGGNNDTLWAVLNTSQSYRSNNFTYTSLSLPLLFEVCSKAKTKNSFYLNVGAVGYWTVGGSWSTRGKYLNGDRFQNTVNSRFQLAPFGAYATTRLGFDHYGLFVNYNLTPLFKKSATATLYPLTFGLTLNLDY
jgi:protein TonB